MGAGIVLVVDRADAARATADHLEDATGVTCVTATDVPSALAVFDDRRVDCVVSEYEIPDDDGVLFRGGRRLLEAVRERDADVPFVLFTDVSNEAVARQGLVEGITACIPKHDRPAADAHLAERVRGAVERHRRMRQADRHNQVTAAVSEVNGALVRADSREAIVDALATELAGDRYDTVAFVACDAGSVGDETATVTAVVGAGPGPRVGDTVAHATVAVDGVTVVDDPAAAPHESLVADGRRALVVPVGYGETRYGALAVTTDRESAFDATERSVLADLGETAGYAIEAVETRAELERQNERLEAFASVVSHDIRNPLQVATVFLDAARGNLDDEPDELARVAEAHDRMLELVDDVLTLAREGQAVVDPREFDLETVARDAWDSVDTGDATLVVETTDTLRGDPSRVRRLFENCFRNAREHASAVPDAADLTVTVDAFDGGFAVSDDGPGIPEKEREDVFEMGYTTAETGTGYGLAIVNELADAHGWAVRATESDDGGARIEILTE